MEAALLLRELTDLISPLSTAVNLAYWELNTAHSSLAETKYLGLKKSLLQIYADNALFKQLTAIRATGLSDQAEARQVELLYATFLTFQIPPGILAEILELEQVIESEFVSFRADFNYQTVADNDLNELLAQTCDNAQAQSAWEASKQIGPKVASQIITLVKLRNQAARELGFANFWEMTLTANELNPQKLMTTLTQLDRLTQEPFTRFKQGLDQSLAAKFQITPEQLQPWNYGDPFFQEVPQTGTNEAFKDYYQQADLVSAVTRFYLDLGLNPTPILTRSDLYERPGKSQHAFCTNIDQAGDVRILCNIRPSKYWANTLLHELGHGVYDLGHDPQLPYFLKSPAHILVTEAVAMLFGSQVDDPLWLNEYLGMPASEVSSQSQTLRQTKVAGQLVFIRWGLVMVEFERLLYQDPDQDLNTLWWALVAHYQMLNLPANRHLPDWAAKIHLGTAPVYYQNYLLGELAASQLNSYINLKLNSNRNSLVQNPAIGNYFKQALFQPGALYPWDDLILKATGSTLSPSAFAAEVGAINF